MDQAFQAVGEMGKYQKKVVFIACMTVYTIFFPLIYTYMSKPPAALCYPEAPEGRSEGMEYQPCRLVGDACVSRKFIIDESKSLDNWALKFNLFCEREYYLPMMSSLFFFGSVISNYGLASIPDKYGRKGIFKIIMIASCFLHLNLLFPIGPVHLMFVSFFCGITTFAGSMAFFIVSEYLPKRLSGLALGIVNALYPILGILLGFYFIFINSYKLFFSFTFVTHCYITYLTLVYFTESPRWLKTMGRLDECIETLRVIADYNDKRKDYEEFLKTNPNFFEGDEVKNKAKNYSLFQIFGFPSQRKNLLILFYVWCVGAFIFFGVVLNLSKMQGDFFYNSILTFLGEMMGESVSGYLIGIYGRVIILRIGVLLGSITFFMFIYSGGFISSILLSVSMFNFGAIFGVVSIYSPETFPTSIRSTACGFLVLGGRLAPILVPPLTSIIGDNINFLFAALPLGTFGLSFYLPETLGKPLPDEIPEEANLKENFSSRESIEDSYKESIDVICTPPNNSFVIKKL